MSSSRRLTRSLSSSTLALVLAACGSTVSGGTVVGAPGSTTTTGLGSTEQPGTGGQAASGAITPLGGASIGGTPSSVGNTGNSATFGPNAAMTSNDAGNLTGRVTQPLTVGILAAGDTQQGAKTAGADSGTSVSAEDTLKALMRYFQHGLAGRPVRFVYKAVPVTTTDYQTELSADCALFTQDNHVDLVISDIGYYADNLTACLNNAHVPQIEGGWGLTDDATFAKYPGYFTPAFPSYDLRFGSLIAAGVTSGALTRGMKVGVMVEDCPFIQRAYRAQLLPRAQAAGLVLDESTVQCTSGFQDAGAIAQQAQSAAFRFHANNDKTVMFATYPTGVDLTFFSQGASSQQYHPEYWLDSLAEPPIASGAGDYPADQVKNMRGIGWTAPLDVTSPQFTRPEQKSCVALMRTEGVAITRPADYVIAFTACDAFSLVQKALTRDGAQSTYPALISAIERLGSTYSASTLTGSTLLGQGRHYGTVEFALFGYQNGCACFRYTSRPRAWT